MCTWKETLTKEKLTKDWTIASLYYSNWLVIRDLIEAKERKECRKEWKLKSHVERMAWLAILLQLASKLELAVRSREEELYPWMFSHGYLKASILHQIWLVFAAASFRDYICSLLAGGAAEIQNDFIISLSKGLNCSLLKVLLETVTVCDAV